MHFLIHIAFPQQTAKNWYLAGPFVAVRCFLRIGTTSCFCALHLAFLFFNVSWESNLLLHPHCFSAPCRLHGEFLAVLHNLHPSIPSSCFFHVFMASSCYASQWHKKSSEACSKQPNTNPTSEHHQLQLMLRWSFKEQTAVDNVLNHAPGYEEWRLRFLRESKKH